LKKTDALINNLWFTFSSPNTLTNKSSKIKAGSKGDVSILKPT
jgi:hypothetical protein